MTMWYPTRETLRDRIPDIDGYRDVGLKAVTAFMDEAHAIDDQEVQMRFIAAWSMLHGMISLYNSKIVSYTTQDPEAMYEKLIAEFLQLLLRS